MVAVTATTTAAAAYTAMVVGSTGAVGRDLVAELVGSAQCGKVIAFARREIPETQWARTFPRLDMAAAQSKLEVRTIDFDAMTGESLLREDKVDASFCCLGTTRRDAGSAEAFRKVDLEYVTRFAQISKAADVPYFGLLTSVGANKDSWFLYPKTKGEVEANVTGLAFPRTSIFRPGFIDRGDKLRTVEKIALTFMSGIQTSTIAKGMVADYESGASGLTEWTDAALRKVAA